MVLDDGIDGRPLAGVDALAVAVGDSVLGISLKYYKYLFHVVALL